MLFDSGGKDELITRWAEGKNIQEIMGSLGILSTPSKLKTKKETNPGQIE